VVITFYAGFGFEAPRYKLIMIPPQQRVNDYITRDIGFLVAEASSSAFEGNIPGIENLDSDDVSAGTAKFISRVNPNYDNTPFWDAYGMEWQLVFPGRGNAQSMGIAAIEMTVSALTDGSANGEVIGIRERKYYKSIGSPTDSNNPERFLSELDSATAYWRSTDTGSFKGDNRHRAYAWGQQIKDDQLNISNSDIKQLEALQEKEYDTARELLESPYEYNFNGFTPLDEAKWVSFLNEPELIWTSVASMSLSPVGEITNAGSEELIFGVIPNRTNFNAPGHAWVHNFEETYTPCCFDCVHSMIVNYDFLHLHDNLSLVETAGFWTELPSGFTRLIRSTLMLPDPTFQGGETNTAGTNAVLIDESAFTDSQGNAISVDVLNAAGFTQDPTTGQYYVDGSEPNAAVGGPAGPDPNCGV
jgi:hypothetical protein